MRIIIVGCGRVGAGLAEIEHSLWPLASLKGVDELKRGRRGKGKPERGRRCEAASSTRAAGSSSVAPSLFRARFIV